MTDHENQQRYTLEELLAGWPEQAPDAYDVARAAIQLHDGDLRRAIAWLQRPAVGLGNVRPIDHLDTPAHITEVRDLIGRIEHGICI